MAGTFRDRARALAIEKNEECSEFLRRARDLSIDNKERQRLERCAAIYNAQALGVLLAIDLHEKAR